MLRNRSVQARLAAWTAMLCVLAPTGFADTSPGNPPAAGFAHAWCCASELVAASRALPAGRHERLAGPEILLVAQQSDVEGGEDTVEDSTTDRETPEREAADDSNDDPFPGSAKPAGPDLSVEEERDLISRGWD